MFCYRKISSVRSQQSNAEKIRSAAFSESKKKDASHDGYHSNRVRLLLDAVRNHDPLVSTFHELTKMYIKEIHDKRKCSLLKCSKNV